MSERKNDVPDEKQIPRVTVGLPPSRGALLTGKSPIGLSYAGKKKEVSALIGSKRSEQANLPRRRET